MSALFPLLAATAAVMVPVIPGSPEPQSQRSGVQAVALATAEIVQAARGSVETGLQEPQRQVRRNAAGQALVEFE